MLPGRSVRMFFVLDLQTQTKPKWHLAARVHPLHAVTLTSGFSSKSYRRVRDGFAELVIFCIYAKYYSCP
jgi:hypothetical protein